MPESYQIISPSAPDTRIVVSSFYRLVQQRDAEALEALIDEAFAPEAALRYPDSLPYGGSVEGVGKIKRMLVGMLAAEEPIIDPSELKLERMTGPGDEVVAEVSFPWRAPGASQAIAMRAAEWWRFEDGRVREITNFYWDTAACAAQLRQPA